MSKPGRPNLSLAGKREAPTAQKPSRGASSSNRGARGRGRGRGGSGPRQRQELIQTGGVFSEGLGGDFPSRKKDKDVDGSQFAYSRREKPLGGPSSSSADDKKDEKKETINMEGKASFQGWEAIWRSDDEEDETELKALRSKNFVSDLKRGTVMPIVLPQEDQPQFLKVLNKVARLSLEAEDVEEEDKKPVKTDGVAEKPKKPTAQELIAILESARTNLLHIQLPSVVATICHKIEENSAPPMEVDDPANETPNEHVPAPPPEYGLPPGHSIGQIQVTKKGRIILCVEGHSIEMSIKPVVGKQQSTILLEVDPVDPVLVPPGSSRGGIENQLYHMGHVTHNLVGSMSWGELNTSKRPEDNANAEIEVDGEMAEGDPDVRKRLEEADKIQAGWFEDAENWAKGILNL